jgi:hypothetical protein
MYRVMSYSARFNACACPEEVAYEISQDPATLERIRGRRLRILSKYPTEDLREIHTVARFLKQVVDWVLQDEVPSMLRLYIHFVPSSDICV